MSVKCSLSVSTLPVSRSHRDRVGGLDSEDQEKTKYSPGFATFTEVPKKQSQASISSSPGRSEEHTSELQSRVDLVCRLLLEKKKKKKVYLIHNNIDIRYDK